ncbi:MAG: transcriptional regulator NrdR, partial [Pseudomonadota bacterium]
MRCPFCGNTDTQVKDSRPPQAGQNRRRRMATWSSAGRE